MLEDQHKMLTQCELCLAVCEESSLIPVRLGWMDESESPADVTAQVCPECGRIYQDEVTKRRDEE